ncbi:LysR family transcriptional regulator [Idiomarina xiamenensis]|uniref:Transcriptional regulator n=1 Tax=Idiomarina xiamenensis 10-D-4 TaxID=740709 RepID=K2JLG6_9GAMM|nr:LysR family transcriptional regulator [Idiomarina xiamenensis]EKE84321.1 Transcriptional regulator [Idiomarina xiamenensis 10-D-4]
MKIWQGISEFVSVAQTQSFTETAHLLDLSVAQVSRNIAALEQRLQLKLLYRSTRKVSVTEAGQLYLQHCQQLVDGLDEANRAVTQLHDRPAGKLVVTAPIYYGETRIAPILHEFLLLYPELELDFRLTNKQLDLIESRIDLAIRLGRLADSNLMAKRLTDRRQYLVAAPTYVAWQGQPQSIAELAQHQCLRGSMDHWRLQERGQLREWRVRGRVQVNTGVAMLDAVKRGLGIAQLPDYYVNDDLASGELVEVLSDYRPSDEGIWAVYPENRHLAAKVRLLVDFLGERLGSSLNYSKHRM